jgi:hypothetical protein
LSLSGGKATSEPASDYVSTFRGEEVEPDLVFRLLAAMICIQATRSGTRSSFNSSISTMSGNAATVGVAAGCGGGGRSSHRVEGTEKTVASPAPAGRPHHAGAADAGGCGYRRRYGPVNSASRLLKAQAPPLLSRWIDQIDSVLKPLVCA